MPFVRCFFVIILLLFFSFVFLPVRAVGEAPRVRRKRVESGPVAVNKPPIAEKLKTALRIANNAEQIATATALWYAAAQKEVEAAHTELIIIITNTTKIIKTTTITATPPLNGYDNIMHALGQRASTAVEIIHNYASSARSREKTAQEVQKNVGVLIQEIEAAAAKHEKGDAPDEAADAARDVEADNALGASIKLEASMGSEQNNVKEVLEEVNAFKALCGIMKCLKSAESDDQRAESLTAQMASREEEHSELQKRANEKLQNSADENKNKTAVAAEEAKKSLESAFAAVQAARQAINAAKASKDVILRIAHQVAEKNANASAATARKAEAEAKRSAAKAVEMTNTAEAKVKEAEAFLFEAKRHLGTRKSVVKREGHTKADSLLQEIFTANSVTNAPREKAATTQNIEEIYGPGAGAHASKEDAFRSTSLTIYVIVLVWLFFF